LGATFFRQIFYGVRLYEEEINPSLSKNKISIIKKLKSRKIM
jgi:hypothetical protein